MDQTHRALVTACRTPSLCRVRASTVLRAYRSAPCVSFFCAHECVVLCCVEILTEKVDDNSTTAYLTHVLPSKLDAIETQMSRHKNGAAYICSDDFSIADASVYELLDTHLHLAPSLLNKYPNLKG